MSGDPVKTRAKKPSKPKTQVSLADKLVADAKKEAKTLPEQLEIVRFWRDVTCRGNLKARVVCATAIDKLKGLY